MADWKGFLAVKMKSKGIKPPINFYFNQLLTIILKDFSTMLSFYKVGYDSLLSCQVFRLNASLLDRRKAYLISIEEDSKTWLVIQSLLATTFSSTAGQVKYQEFKVHSVKVIALSMPIEFIDTCKRCADFHGLIVKNVSQHICHDGVAMATPKLDNILIIRKKSSSGSIAQIHCNESFVQAQREVDRLREIINLR